MVLSFTLVVVVMMENLANLAFPTIAQSLEGSRTDVFNVAIYKYCIVFIYMF
jgi:hypothetical protein